MTNNIDAAKEAAREISNETNSQIMSHCVMALKRHIEERLKKDGDVNSIFEDRVKSLYGENAMKSSNSSHKAYVGSEYISNLATQGFRSFARIHPKIDKVLSVEDGSISYAFHLSITSHGNKPISYENSFISENCGRFAVGHDVGHTVINLDYLISEATSYKDIKKENLINTISRHYEADFFSYIQSDLRDSCLLELNGDMNLDKAFNDYKSNVESKMEKDLSEEEKTDRFEKIKEIFDKSKKLYFYSRQYTMSHAVLALNKVIETKLQEKLKNLRKKLDELRRKSNEYTKRKDAFIKHIEKTTNEIDKLTKQNPEISIHLIVQNDSNENPTIDCYNRKDEDSKRNLYCFEIIIKEFSELEKEGVCKKVCEAIGCIYFGYESIIKRFDNNKVGHSIGTVLEMQQTYGLNKDEINAFTNELYELRKASFKSRLESVKKEDDLKKRLISYL